MIHRVISIFVMTSYLFCWRYIYFGLKSCLLFLDLLLLNLLSVPEIFYLSHEGEETFTFYDLTNAIFPSYAGGADSRWPLGGIIHSHVFPKGETVEIKGKFGVNKPVQPPKSSFMSTDQTKNCACQLLSFCVCLVHCIVLINC